MAKRNFRLRSHHHTVNLAVQCLCIEDKFINFTCKIANGTMIAHGHLQPQFTSPQYLMKIVYKLKDIPRVWVVSPALHPKAVHLYADKHLCLYWPKEWVWRGDQLIADTIIPWTGSWLFFYELWLDTGKWLGTSSHDFYPDRKRYAREPKHQSP